MTIMLIMWSLVFVGGSMILYVLRKNESEAIEEAKIEALRCEVLGRAMKKVSKTEYASMCRIMGTEQANEMLIENYAA